MSRLASGDLTQEVEALYARELTLMGTGGGHELVQATPLEGGGWCLVYDYTLADSVVGEKVMRQRRCAIFGPDHRPAFSTSLSTEWVPR